MLLFVQNQEEQYAFLFSPSLPPPLPRSALVFHLCFIYVHPRALRSHPTDSWAHFRATWAMSDLHASIGGRKSITDRRELFRRAENWQDERSMCPEWRMIATLISCWQFTYTEICQRNTPPMWVWSVHRTAHILQSIQTVDWVYTSISIFTLVFLLKYSYPLLHRGVLLCMTCMQDFVSLIKKKSIYKGKHWKFL